MPRPRSSILCMLAGLFGVTMSGCAPGDAAAQAEPSAAAPGTATDGSFPAGPYADRDAKLAKQLVDGGALLLDVRTPREFASGHIDGAVNISHTEVGAQIAKIRQLQAGDTHKPIVLYCRSGHRAGLAKRELAAAGFDRVTNLGSIDDWPG